MYEHADFLWKLLTCISSSKFLLADGAALRYSKFYHVFILLLGACLRSLQWPASNVEWLIKILLSQRNDIVSLHEYSDFKMDIIFQKKCKKGHFSNPKGRKNEVWNRLQSILVEEPLVNYMNK